LENPDNGVLLNPVTDGILSPKRQAEIIEVAKSLKKFQPTQIALEVLKRLNKEYRSYLNGNFQLTANEIHQIGFRLAEEMKIERLHASDWNENLENIPDVASWAEKNGSQIFAEIVKRGEEWAGRVQEYLQSHPIREFLLWLNLPENWKTNHRMYMHLACVGSREEPVAPCGRPGTGIIGIRSSIKI